VSGLDALRQLAADLTYAAGPGAARLAASATHQGELEAETGVRVPRMPGPGLQSILARYQGSSGAQAQASNADIVAVANHMAERLADGGVALITGSNR
jgi:hypothetical protein